MEENEWKAQQSQPEMPAHPACCASYKPYRKLLPGAQKPRKQHQRRAYAPIDNSHRAAATRSLDGNQCIRNIDRSEEHTSELQSLRHLVCRLLLEKKKT